MWTMNKVLKSDLKALRFHLKYVVSCRHLSNNSTVRVRFAPSPTGFLHLGGLRTALYNFLFAKSQGGSFILRIEDTDQTRIVDGAVEQLEYDLEWAGIYPDESPSKSGSYGPYLQSQRIKLYNDEVQKLLQNGTAYYCFCSDRRLELLKRDAARRGEIPKYDNHCRNLTEDEVKQKCDSGLKPCIRFKLTPCIEPFSDLVCGQITHNVAEIEGDPVILKSDDFPTYHFANVIDDHYMNISHVLRGSEWLTSTNKHLLLYKAFNWSPPTFAHLPLLLNPDRTKLSKRNQDMTVEYYRNDKIYPRALISFLASYGGGFCKNEDKSDKIVLYNMDDLKEKFTLTLVPAHGCLLPFECLKDFNRLEIKQRISKEETFNEMVKDLKCLVEKTFHDSKNVLTKFDNNKIKEILIWSTNRISKLTDLIHPDFSFLWIEPPKETFSSYDDKYFEALGRFINKLQKIGTFQESSFNSAFYKDFAEMNELGYAPFMKFLRMCLTGLKYGPGVSEIFVLLEKGVVIQRLERAQLIWKNNSVAEAIS